MNTCPNNEREVARCIEEVQSEETIIWRTALVELAMREGQVDPRTAVGTVVMTHTARMQ